MQLRTSLPEYGNKFYNNGNNGGWSWCVNGYPTCEGRNVLANCVGYACGRFNEIIGEMRYKELCCNAERFVARASELGLQVVPYPVLGGIMVWEGIGKGAGHVAIVERIDSATRIYTSESDYGGKAFFNAYRDNSNGRWGLSGNFAFLGCIINPAIGDIHWVEPAPEPTPEPVVKELNIGTRVKAIGEGNGSSYGDSNVAWVGNEGTIARIIEDRPYPYLISDEEGPLGWYKAEDLEII